MARDRAPNTLKQARRVSLTAQSQVFRDFVGPTDTEDIYRLNFTKRSNFNLTLSRLGKGAKVDAELYALKDSHASILRRIGRLNFAALRRADVLRNLIRLGRSVLAGKGTETLKAAVEAGEYYLRIVSRQGGTAYTLTLANTLVSDANVGDSLPDGSSGSNGADSHSSTAGNTSNTGGSAGTEEITNGGNGSSTNPGTGNGGTGNGSDSDSDSSGDGTGGTPPDASTSLSIRQLGSRRNDYAYDIAVDPNGVYIVGATSGALPGNTTSGKTDAFITSYTSEGDRQWVKQVGTPEDDGFVSLALDSNGYIYAAGARNGVAPSLDILLIKPGSGDAYAMKYDQDGNAVWSSPIVFDSGGIDAATGVAVDSTDSIYLAGLSATLPTLLPNLAQTTVKPFIKKYDSDGNVKPLTGDLAQIQRQYNQSAILGITVDRDNNLYITGITYSEIETSLPALLSIANSSNLSEAIRSLLKGENIFIAKYSSDGTKLWDTTLSTPVEDYVAGIAVDPSGNVYITGDTKGSLTGNVNQGGIDGFIAKYDTTSNATAPQWLQQFGTQGTDQGQGITVDDDGNPYITGEVFQSATNSQAFLAKLNPLNGDRLFFKEIGTPKDDEAYGITVDSADAIYVTGQTQGALDGSPIGDYDVWIGKQQPL